MRGASIRPWRDGQLFGDFGLTSLFENRSGSPARAGARRTRRVLLLSVSAGNGHVRAAEAIKAHARADFASLDVRHQDVMQLVPRAFRIIYTDAYMALAHRLPEAWGWLYRRMDHVQKGSRMDAIRKLIQNICTRKLLRETEEFVPEIIVCTHFLPAEILVAAARRGSVTAPIWVQVTDFDLHQMWIHEGITGYFVANEELAYRLRTYGVPGSRIVVTGIPVMPGFTARPARTSCAMRLGLDPQRMTVLLMGGGSGMGEMDTMARQLLDLNADFQLIVLAGKNKALLQSLRTLAAAYPQHLLALGFTDKVHEVMACADIAITKPGGLSTSECLVMGLPMVLVNPIPGQEERNAGFLLQEGVAVRADDPVTLQYRLLGLLTDRDRLARMRERALSIARPHAACELLQHVLYREA